MLIMAGSLLLVLPLDGHAGFGSLMPGFVLFGFGAGFMTVPLTNAVLHAIPQERAGIVSALLNASREIAGLLGITVIGAVLRAAQSHALRTGSTRPHAFLAGYHAGLTVTIGLLAAGVVVSYLTLRPGRATDADV
jgi:hypothetical protein